MASQVKIKIDKVLYARLDDVAKIGGYSSTDEFIIHILEKESSNFDEVSDDAEVEKQLRGLGYIE